MHLQMNSILKYCFAVIGLFFTSVVYSQSSDTTITAADIEKMPYWSGHVSKSTSSSGSLIPGNIEGHIMARKPDKRLCVKLYAAFNHKLIDSVYTNKKGYYCFKDIFGEFTIEVTFKNGMTTTEAYIIKVLDGKTKVVDL